MFLDRKYLSYLLFVITLQSLTVLYIEFLRQQTLEQQIKNISKTNELDGKIIILDFRNKKDNLINVTVKCELDDFFEYHKTIEFKPIEELDSRTTSTKA